MNEHLILVSHICNSHQIDPEFFATLDSYGLVELVIENEVAYIHTDHLIQVEKMIRLHFELGINFEGIDVISNLLGQIDNLQKELTTMRNKLQFYDFHNIK